MYTFIKKTNQETNEVSFSAIAAEKIETLAISDTYDQYGQTISAADAGDYIILLSQAAVDAANEAYAAYHSDNEIGLDPNETKWSIGDAVSAYDWSMEGYEIYQDNSLKEGVDYTHEKETIKGFNYWDGHNWQTIVVEHSEYTEYEVLKDEELITELTKALEEKEWVKDGFGSRIYEGNGYQIIDDNCQGAWSAYDLVTLETAAMLDAEAEDYRNKFGQ